MYFGLYYSCISDYALLVETNSCVMSCPNGYSLEASTYMDLSFAIAMCVQQGTVCIHVL